MSEPTDALERNAGLTPIRPEPFPKQEVEQQYPTKPFGPLVSDEGVEPPATGEATPTPMELAGRQGGQQGQQQMTPDELRNSVGKTLNSSNALKGDLIERFPNLSDGQKALLMAKLTKYQGQAGKAAKLLGAGTLSPERKAEIVQELEKAKHPSGMVQFLSLITGGDDSMRAVVNKLASTSTDNLNPVQIFKAQAALQSASKSVNFATAVIGQGLNFVKTLMQTQV
jgi:hypothetical protein